MAAVTARPLMAKKSLRCMILYTAESLGSVKGYSCAGICVSESRQAEIFNRLQTQHRPSFELGDVAEAHTTHFVTVRRRRSFIASAFAPSRISGATTGSAAGCGLRFKSVSPISITTINHNRDDRASRNRLCPSNIKMLVL